MKTVTKQKTLRDVLGVKDSWIVITPEQFAQLTGIPKFRLRKYYQDGLPRRGWGRSRRINIDDLEKFLSENGIPIQANLPFEME